MSTGVPAPPGTAWLLLLLLLLLLLFEFASCASVSFNSPDAIATTLHHATSCAAKAEEAGVNICHIDVTEQGHVGAMSAQCRNESPPIHAPTHRGAVLSGQ
jgi:hypothetical protein